MKTHCLDTDTPLIPEIIADSIANDLEMRDMLCARARWHYSNQPKSIFAARMRGRHKCDPRVYLRAYMSHWNTAGKARMRKWLETKQQISPVGE